MNKGQIEFKCNDETLNEGFIWAKKQALEYAHEGDLVGNWYEAALPGRQAFCMRDVSHHITGAHYLGLDSHSRNMLLRFAQNMAESRDFCSFWEITKDYAPAKADYRSDAEFWYNLPANFDVLDACWRAYKLTGDKSYINSYDLNHFYDVTVHEYVERWDHDGDGVPDRAVFGNFRGIPSYDEQQGMEQAVVAADLIAAQIRGYLSYAALAKLRGINAEKSVKEAQRLKQELTKNWWDSNSNSFFSAKLKDGSFVSTLGSPHLLAYFNVIEDTKKLHTLLEKIHADALQGVIVELMSHYPEIFYKNADKEKGLYWLLRCIDPKLERREYPEVSFAAVGAYIECLMGISPDASAAAITTVNHLPAHIHAAEIKNCPVFGGTIDYTYANGIFTLKNHTGQELLWNGCPVADGESKSLEF